MELPARHRPLAAGFAIAAATAMALTGAAFAQEVAKQCQGYPRLVPSDYARNAEQFDAVCLPEAWYFMQSRWQALSLGGPRWPGLVVIDDGFFSSQDSAVRPWLFRGYPDGSGAPPLGTADGDSAQNPPAYGLHGTRVLSLLASDVGNGWIAGVVGPWRSVPNGSLWGASFVPARSGRGFPTASSPGLVEDVFRGVVLPRPENRVVNISQYLASVTGHAGLEQVLNLADWNQTVVVTGAGNNKEVIDATAWIRRFENVVVVGGLNPTGTALWRETIVLPDHTKKEIGSATGAGVDLYAPAQAFELILRDAQIVTDSGTSFAAPLVAGAVAMMQNVDPTLDSWVMRDILVKTADPGTYPRLNVLKALLCTDALLTGVVWSNPPIRTWECNTGTFGKFRGERRGW